MPDTKHKKWQRPKLLVFTKSDSEVKLLEAASTSNPPCLRPENKDGRCYKSSDRILTTKTPRHKEAPDLD